MLQGYNIKFGKGVYINFSACFLDCNTIEIGDDCLLGPYVQIYPPGHPLDAEVRDGLRGPEFARPVKIERGCWIGGHVIIQGTTGGAPRLERYRPELWLLTAKLQ